MFFLLQDARQAAEEEIYTNLNQKIDQFLQLADYDWMAVESSDRASDYLVDLVAFLNSTFAVFTHLPVSRLKTGAISKPIILEWDIQQVYKGVWQIVATSLGAQNSKMSLYTAAFRLSFPGNH